MIRSIAFCAAAVCAVTLTLHGQQQQEIASATVYRNSPARQPFSDALLSRLRLPPGFRISAFARGLNDPRMIDIAADGTVYVTRWKSDDVLALRDLNNDGVADQQLVLGQLDGVHGIDLVEPFLVVASPREVWAAPVSAGRVTGAPFRLVSGLPDGAQHENRVVKLGPDGLLYVSVGSSCNDCVEENQLERATIIRYSQTGRRVDVLAKGLRNTIGYDWHPDTGELWGMDMGSDFRGNDIPPDELNRIQTGRHYGWPICYAERIVDTMTTEPPMFEALRPGESQPPLTMITRAQFCAQTEPSVLPYTAHSSPLALQFYRSNQFPGFRNDALVTFRGSWNRQQPSGYKVVRLRFNGGTPVAFEDFVTGFLSEDGTSFFGRPVGLATAPDGSVLFTDDQNGIIYRVVYGQ